MRVGRGRPRNGRFTAEQIKEFRSSKKRCADLARENGVTHQTMWNILHHRIYQSDKDAYLPAYIHFLFRKNMRKVGNTKKAFLAALTEVSGKDES